MAVTAHLYPANPACAAGAEFGVPAVTVPHPAAASDASAATPTDIGTDLRMGFMSCPPSGVTFPCDADG
jgi:hypothetical protein